MAPRGAKQSSSSGPSQIAASVEPSAKAAGGQDAGDTTAAPDLARMKRYFTESEQLTQEARKQSLTALDYYDSDQFTREEMSILQTRGQPAIVVNRIKPAVNAFRAGRSEAAGPADLGLDELRGRIASLAPEQRAAADRQAEILGALGRGLASQPYAQRRAILDHMAPQIAARGLAPGAIAGFDPTDANLAAVVGQTVILQGMLGEGAKASPVQPDGTRPPDPEPKAE